MTQPTLGSAIVNKMVPYAWNLGRKAIGKEVQPFEIVLGTIEDQTEIERRMVSGRSDTKVTFQKKDYLITGIRCLEKDGNGRMKAELEYGGGLLCSHVTLNITALKAKEGKGKTWNCEIVICGENKADLQGRSSSMHPRKLLEKTEPTDDPFDEDNWKEFGSFRRRFFSERTQPTMTQEIDETPANMSTSTEESSASCMRTVFPDDPDVEKFGTFSHPFFSTMKMPDLQDGEVHTETTEEDMGNGVRRKRTFTIRRIMTTKSSSSAF